MQTRNIEHAITDAAGQPDGARRLHFVVEIDYLNYVLNLCPPILDVKKISNKLNLINHIADRTKALNEFTTFCNVLIPALELILNSKFNPKRLQKELNKQKQAIEYFKLIKNSEYFAKIDNVLTLQINLKVIAKGEEGIKEFHTKLNYCAQNREATLQNEVNELKTKYKNLLSFLDSIEENLNSFDKALANIYECPISLFENNHYHKFIENRKIGAPQPAEIDIIMKQLTMLSSGNNDIYLIGNGPQDYAHIHAKMEYSVSVDMKIIRQFSFKFNKEPNLPFTIKEKKHSLLTDFNSKLQQSLTIIPMIQEEKAHEENIDYSAKNRMRIKHFSNEEPSVTLAASNRSMVNVIVLSKQLKNLELQKITGINCLLINKDPALMFHAEVAYRIAKVTLNLDALQNAFSFSPDYLFVNELSLVNEDEVTKVEKQNENLQSNYNLLVNSVKDKPFNFANNSELIAALNIIENEITQAIRDLKDNPTQSKLQLVQKNLYKAAKILGRFSINLDIYLQDAEKVVINYEKTQKDLIDFSNQLAEYKIQLAKLEEPTIIWMTRSKAPLQEIKDVIQLFEENLKSANKIFTECPEPIDSNVLVDTNKSLTEINYIITQNINSYITQIENLFEEANRLLTMSATTRQNSYMSTNLMTFSQPRRQASGQDGEDEKKIVNTPTTAHRI